MFTETVIHAGGLTEGTASEPHAFRLIRQAIRRGYTVTPTKAGGAVITWTARHPIRNGTTVEEPRSISLTPQTPAGPITNRLQADLLAVHRAGAALPCIQSGRTVIRTGAQCIGPAATSRLYAHRLVVEEGGRVRLTLVAYLALLAARQARPEDVAAVFCPELTRQSA